MGGRGGECDNKGKKKTRGKKKTWGRRERGEGDEGITKLKTNVIPTATERKQCVLLGEACLAACSRGWVRQTTTFMWVDDDI